MSAAPEQKNHFSIIRLVLASLVLVSHSFQLIDGDRLREPLFRLFHSITFGELAVDFFFVLSGYLVAQSYMRSKNAWQFLVKRGLRIYPGFIVVTVLGVFVLGYLFASDRGTYYSQISLPRFVIDLVQFKGQTVPPTFLQCPIPIINESLWTIRYEAECYLLVLILGLSTLLRRPQIVAAGFAICLSLYVWRCTQDFRAAHDSVLRFVVFFLPGVVYFAFEDVLRLSARWLWAGGVLLVVAMLHPVTGQLALATIGTVLFFSLGFVKSSGLDRLRPSKDISYGTYLYGWPIQQVLIAGAGIRVPLALLGLSLPLALACGYVSWTLVESPFLSLKKKL